MSSKVFQYCEGKRTQPHFLDVNKKEEFVFGEGKILTEV